MVSQAEMAKPDVSARELLADPAFWMIAFTVAIVTSGMKGMITNLAPLAIDNGMASDAAKLISVYAGCGSISKLSFAALADRLGPRVLMFASLGGFGAGMAFLTQAGAGFVAISLSIAIIGLFGGLMVPIESFLAPRVFGQRVVGRALGLLSGTILVALLATPPLFGLIFDRQLPRHLLDFGQGLAAVALLWVPAMRLQPRDHPPARMASPNRLAGPARERRK